MSSYTKKVLISLTAAISVILIIDFLNESHHWIVVALNAIIISMAVGLAYDLGKKSKQQFGQNKKYFIFHKRSMLCARYGLGWSYAEADGGCVSKYAVSWHKINGVWINTPWWACWLLFRRPSW